MRLLLRQLRVAILSSGVLLFSSLSAEAQDINPLELSACARFDVSLAVMDGTLKIYKDWLDNNSSACNTSQSQCAQYNGNVATFNALLELRRPLLTQFANYCEAPMNYTTFSSVCLSNSARLDTLGVQGSTMCRELGKLFASS